MTHLPPEMPSDPGHRPSVETRRSVWASIPTFLALALAAGAAYCGYAKHEVGGYLMAAFILVLAYLFLWKPGAADRSGGQ